MAQENNIIPQHVADGVSIEAGVFEQNYYSSYSTFKQIVPDVYKKAVQPYADKVYILEQLVKSQEQLIKILKDTISEVSNALTGAQECIDNILKK